MAGVEGQPTFLGHLINKTVDRHIVKGPTFTGPDGGVEAYTVYNASADAIAAVGTEIVDRLPEIIRAATISPRRFSELNLFDNDSWEGFARDLAQLVVMAHVESEHPEIVEEDKRRVQDEDSST